MTEAHTHKLIIPGVLETMQTGVVAAAEGQCAITGETLRLQYPPAMGWQFFAGGKKVSKFARQSFYDAAREAIMGYLRTGAA